MTIDKFQKRAAEIFANCLEISKGKQSDYCSNEDPFDNFKRCTCCGVSVEQGIFTRLSDKFSRAGSLIKKNHSGEDRAVKDEALVDTLDDLIMYTAILKIYIEEQEELKKAKKQ